MSDTDVTPPKRRTKFDVRREATRKALLDAGIEIFWERGYTRATAAEVATRAGCTTGAFYFHFPGKEEFFLAVMDHRERLRRGWQAAATASTPPPETLEQAVRAARKRIDERMHGFDGWTRVMVDFHHQVDDPAYADAVRRLYDGWMDELAVFVRGLQALGLVDAAHDPERLARLLYAIDEGVNVHATLYGIDDREGLLQAQLAILAAPAWGPPPDSA